MKSNQHALYDRISEFSFDEGDEQLPFARRLARENVWPPHYAARVMDEYKRFMFLAAVSGHPVSPSDQVDQAWHMHLVYTRSYWDRFCGEVLGKPFHHGPTRGGQEELRKHQRWYAQTLESYTRFFGCEPPADIWPDASVRFGEELHYRRVNIRRNWVFPKPRSKGPAKMVLLLALVLLTLVITTVGLSAQFGGGGQPRPLDGSIGSASSGARPDDISTAPQWVPVKPDDRNGPLAPKDTHLSEADKTTALSNEMSPAVTVSIIVAIGSVIVLCAIFGNTCPECHRRRGMYSTGEKSKDGKQEQRCKYCGHQEWNAESGCGGCCG